MTRRSKSWEQPNRKKLVDNTLTQSLDLSGASPEVDKAGLHNRKEGIIINEDVWSEMITVGKFLCLIQEDPDIYDLFDWIRINLCSGQPYGEGLLARVDAEILRELGPWSTT